MSTAWIAYTVLGLGIGGFFVFMAYLKDDDAPQTETGAMPQA